MGNFDLRDVLANRAYPIATIKVILDEKILFEISDLYQRLDAVPVSKEDPGDLQRKLDAKVAERDASAYTVHLRGTSPRAREDMQSEALSQFPILRDAYGREDPARGLQRGSLLSELYFAAHITKIVSPSGEEQVWDDENSRDLARAFLDLAPEVATKTVDAAIIALRGEQNEQFAKIGDVDFLSRT